MFLFISSSDLESHKLGYDDAPVQRKSVSVGSSSVAGSYYSRESLAFTSDVRVFLLLSLEKY